MKLYPLLLLLVTLFSSCSKYTLSEEESSSDEKKQEKVNVYVNFRKNMSGDFFDIEYPIRIFCVDKFSSALTEFYFGEGEGVSAQVDKGEYSVNAFIGINKDDFTLMNDINGKPMLSINESGVSVTPVLSAHSTLNIEKQTEINFIPEYIVSSIEFEFSNIPSGVKSLSVEISPVCCGYYVEGSFSGRTQAAFGRARMGRKEWVQQPTSPQAPRQLQPPAHEGRREGPRVYHAMLITKPSAPSGHVNSAISILHDVGD